MRRSSRKAVADDAWSRAVEVSEPQKHPQDFTIYKVVLRMTPLSTTEDEYEILVYKRYRQFRRLHKILSTFHEKLHRVDKFPPFTKPTMFGRFDTEVVEERRQAAEIFLNFCCQQRHLYTHAEFMLFFEGGIRSNPKSSLRNPVAPFDFATFAGPQSAYSDTTSSEQRPSCTDDPEVSPSAERAEVEELVDPLPPLVTGDGDSLDGQTDRLVDVSLTSPLPESDLSFFDPCSATARGAVSTVAEDSNVWLLTAMDACSEPDVAVARRESAISFASSDNSDIPSADQRPKGGVKTFFANLKDKARQAGRREDSGDAYIFSAAALIKHAQEAEAARQFEEAFNAYKTGVGILLAGVQADADPARREVVRQRTGRYLVHAEAIYNQHLAHLLPGPARSSPGPECAGDQRWQISDSSVMLSLDPTLSRLHFSVAELRSYKVLGILHERVLLVMDVSANRTCVIKSIRKCSVMDNEVQPCVPTNVPFMVQLLKIVETEDTIYLVLEYATGGRLYDFVKDYLSDFPGRDETDRGPVQPGDLPAGENVYTGHQFPSVGDLNGGRDAVSKRSSDSDHSEDGGSHARGYVNMFSQCIADFEQGRQEGVSEDVEEAMEQSADPSGFQRVLNGASKDAIHFSIGSLSSDGEEADGPETSIQEADRAESALHEATPECQEKPPVPQETAEESASRDQSRSRSASAQRRCSRQRSHSIGAGEEPPRQRAWSTVFAQLDAERAKEAPQLPESCLRQWTAEIVTALLSLHRRGLVVGDLHPGNLLLGRGGHILLTFVSRWKQAPWRPCPEAVDGGYAAPEVLTLDGPQEASDWFSVGVVLFELLTGKAFIAAFPGGISSHSVIQLPEHVSSEAQDLVHNLLTYHPNQRLGTGNISDIKLHPFFKDIQWKRLRHQR